jgi:hypothetical protein
MARSLIAFVATATPKFDVDPGRSVSVFAHRWKTEHLEGVFEAEWGSNRPPDVGQFVLLL